MSVLFSQLSVFRVYIDIAVTSRIGDGRSLVVVTVIHVARMTFFSRKSARWELESPSRATRTRERERKISVCAIQPKYF